MLTASSCLSFSLFFFQCSAATLSARFWISSTQSPSRACSAALLAARRSCAFPLALRMLDPSSMRIHHAFLHHVMCLFDTSFSSCIGFVFFNAFLLRWHLFFSFAPFLGLNFSVFFPSLLLSLCPPGLLFSLLLSLHFFLLSFLTPLEPWFLSPAAFVPPALSSALLHSPRARSPRDQTSLLLPLPPARSPPSLLNLAVPHLTTPLAPTISLPFAFPIFPLLSPLPFPLPVLPVSLLLRCRHSPPISAFAFLSFPPLVVSSSSGSAMAWGYEPLVPHVRRHLGRAHRPHFPPALLHPFVTFLLC